MISLSEVDIVESPLLKPFSQNQKLSEGVMVTPKFRIEFNKWLKDFFGTERNFYMIKVGVMVGQPHSHRDCIVTHPDNVKFLERHLKGAQ